MKGPRPLCRSKKEGGHRPPNIILKVKILQSKKQKISKKIVKVITEDPFTLQREWSNI